MADRVARFDWAATPLGEAAAWPQSLKTAIGIVLGSRFPKILLWGHDLIQIYNDAYRQIIGDKHPAALGMPSARCWPEVWDLTGPIYRRVFAGETVYLENQLYRLQRRAAAFDDVHLTICYSPVPAENASVGGVLVTMIETTELLAAQTAARDANTRLEQRATEAVSERNLWAEMAESTDALVVAAGPDYRLLAINKAWQDEFEGIYGVRPQVGDDFIAVLAGQPEQQAAARAVWDRAFAGEAFTIVEEHGDPERKRPSYELKFTPLRDPGGRIRGAFLYGQDVTDRLRDQARLAEAERRLRQSQKLETIGQLTGGIAHDFNNLLTIIRSSVDFLRRRELPEERRRRYIDAISDTVDRAAKLTGQLLAFARRQPLKPEVFDIGTRVAGVAELLRPIVGARIRIETSGPAAPCFVEADIAQFDTALMNLAVNARDAMNGEGTITMAVAADARIPPGRAQSAARDLVAVSVTDTGAGIPPDQLPRIFEPFFTTKEIGKGTGLGLSQVFGFAEQSGGGVDVVSEVGRGTTVTLYLPRASAAPALDAVEDAAHPAAGGRGTCVLVVEDNADVGTFSTQTLEDLGYRTAWARNAEEALALLRDGEQRFDVVFSDVVMPGMSGVELGETIRRLYPGLPVVLTSGYSEVLAEEGRRGFELLQKPYSVESMSRALRKAVAEGQRRPVAR
jgi:signal transduction histidine kinase/ActR/RegA family two-component response regulator